MRDGLAYRSQLQALLPPGAAWPRSEDAQLTMLLQALADGLARADARAMALIEEADPLTALEMLPDWERAVGLPDPCSTISDNIRERQLAVARKLSGIGGQSRAFFVNLAQLLGLEVEIEEFAPFAVGSLAGQELFNDAWRHAFTVRTLPDSLLYGENSRLYLSDFAVGESSAGDRLRSFGSSNLECVISRAKPAHSEVLFAYLVDPEPMLWFDFTVQ